MSADPTRWRAVSETNAAEARAQLAECNEALFAGDLLRAAELCQSAASKLRTAAVLDYVDRHERQGPSVAGVTPADSVRALKLPIAMCNNLENRSISTVGDLLGMSERDLWRTQGVGRKSIATIKARLASAGLGLREDGEA